MLVLDEPMNHLDIEMVEVLAQALNDFNGGMVLVTHNERLITLVCNELWLCDNQTVTIWPADLSNAYSSIVSSCAAATATDVAILLFVKGTLERASAITFFVSSIHLTVNLG